MNRLPCAIRFRRFLSHLAAVIAVAFTSHAADFSVNTSTYLGSPGNDEVNAVDIASDGRVIIGGASPGKIPGETSATALLGGGNGIVIRMNAGAAGIAGFTRIGSYVNDLEAGPDGSIAATGSFGAALLSADASRVLWCDSSIIKGELNAGMKYLTLHSFTNREHHRNRMARVAIGSDGTVASVQHTAYTIPLADGTPYWQPDTGHVYVWKRDGTRLFSKKLPEYKYIEDICVDGKNGLVIIGGFNTYKADSPYMKDHPIHMPFIVAYDYTGKKVWEDYNFTAANSYARNIYADSRVQRLTIGRDGYLYMGGYIHGGDYVWKFDPKNVNAWMSVETNMGDWYSQAVNMGPGLDFAYFARFDPATGAILKGQALLCRENEDGGGKPRPIQIKAIHADASGKVFLGGVCESYTKARASCRINGTAVGAYADFEAFLLVVAPDFRTREVWTVFSGSGCESTVWGLSVRGKQAVLAGEVFQGSVITSTNAPQKTTTSGHEGFLVSWGDLTVSAPPDRRTGKGSRARDRDAAGMTCFDIRGRVLGNPEASAMRRAGIGVYFDDRAGTVGRMILRRGSRILQRTSG